MCVGYEHILMLPASREK